MLRSIDISTSGLVAQRQRLNTISGNIAHANTTRNADGEVDPFQRRIIRFAEDDSRHAQTPGGVSFHVEIDTETPPRQVYAPGHPDADADGYVSFPNVDLTTEFVNALLATRAYEANVAAIQMTEQMAGLTLQILA